MSFKMGRYMNVRKSVNPAAVDVTSLFSSVHPILSEMVAWVDILAKNYLANKERGAEIAPGILVARKERDL